MIAQSCVTSNETLTYTQAMHEIDYHEFVKAMIKEVEDHENQNHWIIMHCCNMPMDTKATMSIWSFKCKRYPDGSLNKYKVRLCTHCGMLTWEQTYWEMYAPVVDWASVRLILAIAKFMDCRQKVLLSSLHFRKQT